jgi:chromosomal replication initiator protein
MNLKEEVYAQTYRSILESVDEGIMNALQEAVVMREMAYLGRRLSEIKISVKEIVKLVEEDFDVTLESMKGSTRLRSIVIPRQTIMWLIRNTMRNMTTVSIGKLFDRDHATVIHACRAIDNQIQTDIGYRNRLCVILNKLGYKTKWSPSKKGIGGEFTMEKATNHKEA